MSDLQDRFRAAMADADTIFWRPQSSPAEMFRELAAYAEEHGTERSGRLKSSGRVDDVTRHKCLSRARVGMDFATTMRFGRCRCFRTMAHRSMLFGSDS